MEEYIKKVIEIIEQNKVKTANQICDILTDHNLSTPKGKFWSQSSLAGFKKKYMQEGIKNNG